MNRLVGFRKFWVFSVIGLITVFTSMFAQQPPAGAPANAPMGGFGMQPTGTIKGVVIDSATGAPIEFASVVLYKASTKKMISGAQTEEKTGLFTIEQLPFGKYFIRVSTMGYLPKKTDTIEITEQKPTQFIGKIKLKSSAKELNTVVVATEKKEIENHIDKMVVNVDKNAAAVGGTVNDVLQTVPSVSVDADGNVSLRGAQNVVILIDGKPSTLTSLDQMPASMVDKIEIMTNPSAKYDPDGMAGMINIITKKKDKIGFNAAVILNAGSYNTNSITNNNNISVMMGYKYKKVNLYMNFAQRSFNRIGYTNTTRETDSAIASQKKIGTLNQTDTARRNGSFQNFKLGIDYDFNDKNTISAYGLYNWRHFNAYEDLYSNNTSFEKKGNSIICQKTQRSINEKYGWRICS